MYSTADPCVLTKPAFRLIEEDLKGAIQEVSTYICDICWKFEFWRNVTKLKEMKYQADIYNKHTMGKSDWICKILWPKKKKKMWAQWNNMELFPKFSELDSLFPIELMLISQIIPFMYVVAISERSSAWT